jgi:hypothetical protein
MGQVVVFTEKPVRVTSVNDVQELRLAFDALEVDEIDVILHLLSVEGGSPSLTLALQTGMEIDTADGWTTTGALTFSAMTTANSVQLKNFKNFARFLRWKVTAFSGTAFTFMMTGVGRRWGG